MTKVKEQYEPRDYNTLKVLDLFVANRDVTFTRKEILEDTGLREEAAYPILDDLEKRGIIVATPIQSSDTSELFYNLNKSNKTAQRFLVRNFSGILENLLDAIKEEQGEKK